MQLGEFSDACLLHTLRSRFEDVSQIYTQIGSAILVSINPYCDRAELYSADVAKAYQKASKNRKLVNDQKELEPHLFKVAEEAFQSMKSTATNQEIIISGISGSGKTEASKLMLAYLVNACNNFRFMEASIEESTALSDDSFENQVSGDEDDGVQEDGEE